MLIVCLFRYGDWVFRLKACHCSSYPTERFFMILVRLMRYVACTFVVSFARRVQAGLDVERAMDRGLAEKDGRVINGFFRVVNGFCEDRMAIVGRGVLRFCSNVYGSLYGDNNIDLVFEAWSARVTYRECTFVFPILLLTCASRLYN